MPEFVITKSMATNSTALTPTISMGVFTDYDAFSLYHPGLEPVGSSAVRYKGRHCVSHRFKTPIFSTSSAIVYGYNNNIPNSTGLIYFNNFFLPNGLF